MIPAACNKRCLDNACENCVDVAAAWTSAAAKVAQRKQIVADIREQAGKAFVDGDEDLARVLRNLALKLENEGRDTENALNSFINDDVALRKKAKKS